MKFLNIVEPYFKFIIAIVVFFMGAKLVLKIIDWGKSSLSKVRFNNKLKDLSSLILEVSILIVIIQLIPSLFFLFIFIAPFLVVAFLGKLKGNVEATRKLNREIKKVKLANPYIYYREIPDDYGIGVYALLLDYKISTRDFKSALIDLAAKKYLKIDAINDYFEIKLLDNNADALLENEKYILKWIRENGNRSIKEFNLSNWKKEIRKDIINLGLGAERDDLKSGNIKKRYKLLRLFAFIPSILGILTYYIYLFITNTGFLPFQEGIDSIMKIVLFTMCRIIVNLPIACLIFCCLSIVFYILGTLIGTFIFTSHDAYYFKMLDNLEYTDKTVESIHKIYSLSSFLKDFSIIAERNIDEIIIWERYFAYAYLLKLNDKLELKYTKIYKNDNFTLEKNIDDISSIVIK